jgi:hypothetical protein
MNPQQSDRKKDLVQYPIQENVLLEVYWRDDAGGHGPAASLYIHDDEVFRFDCFGGDQGHCHYNLRQTRGQRWYYEEGTVQENIDRSVFELTKNLPFCLMNNQNEAIQATKIDQDKLQQASAQMRTKLLDFADQLGF